MAETQNEDGGWGDTTHSFSNISTTALCWCAFGLLETDTLPGTFAEMWLGTAAGSLDPKPLSQAIIARYGKDRTFSVPILTMLALAGRLGPMGWRFVPQLPFELAACPFRWFQLLQLPVVSYALPALIAIGHVRHFARPSWNPVLRLVRWLVTGRTLRKLHQIQPTTGGFLEATPLTSFVVMSLIGCGQADHPVVVEGVKFLERSARADGSWAIDTNLATWVTTLAVNALLDGPNDPAPDFPPQDRAVIRDWLLNQQYRVEHPSTHAAPGGWAWTDLPGGIPDADDTPGALLALFRLGLPIDQTLAPASMGVRWLLDLQNRDGGIPTFCRGWTGLPFDRSSADLTAHTILAWAAWLPHCEEELQRRIQNGVRRGIRYLMRTQRSDGAWAPLWFGCQHSAEIENLTYGTSRVLRLATVNDGLGLDAEWQASLIRARDWLVTAQNPDGGWGGRPNTPASIEETSLALESLAPMAEVEPAVFERGLHWLNNNTKLGTDFPPSPIGFYFANLWYFERLYPLIDSVAATSRLTVRFAPAGRE